MICARLYFNGERVIRICGGEVVVGLLLLDKGFECVLEIVGKNGDGSDSHLHFISIGLSDLFASGEG